jgi:hypothetical protein
VPSVTFGNVRSVVNKLENLRVNCRYLFEFREASIIGLVETWLNDNIPDSAVEISGYHLVRSDRTLMSGKSRGGGIALLLNERWCNNVTVKEKMCTKDVELLSVSIRPFYLPREFSNVFVTALYIPPDAHVQNATDHVQEVVVNLMNNKPDALHIILGDANHAVDAISNKLPNYTQYVSCATRNETLLDPFYCNVKNSYRSVELPPLMNSDHKMIHMQPIYKSKLKQVKPKTIMKTSLNSDSEEALNACFESTDWDLFIQDCKVDVNALTDVVG